MSNARLVGGLCVLSASVLVACGGGSSPAQPAPVPTATPVPVPTAPPLALSVIPPCSLPASNAGNAECSKKEPQRLTADVHAAIDRVLAQRPDLFDFNDVNGGPAVVKYEGYMTAVAAAINQTGLCAVIGPEGEIGVKTTNSYSEQWIIVSRIGWGAPTSHWVSRKYVCTTYPAGF